MSLRQIVRHIKLAAPRVGSGQLLQQQTRTAVFAATTPLLETKTIQVPTMGDSITEVRQCVRASFATPIDSFILTRISSFE